MLKYQRIVFTLALCCLISGCATYTPVGFPVEQGNPKTSAIYWERIKSRSPVRITTSDGQQYIGRVVAATPNNLMFQTSGNYGNREVVIDRDNIAKVEIGNEPHGGGLMAVTMILSVILLATAIGWIDFTLGS